MRSRERLPAALLFAALLVAVLFAGGAFRWVEATTAILVASAIVSLLLSRRTFTRTPPLIATLGAAAVLTALQLVPLPSMLVHSLQPVGAALRDEGAELAGTSPWQALTLDAPATLRGLCFFIILLGVAWVALRLAVSSSGRYRILVAFAAVCGIAAIVTGVHELVGAKTLFGLYEPDVQPTVLGPLLNTNHLGCLMSAGAVVGIGLAMYSRQRSLVRVMWLGVVAACAAVAVATSSRGATLALIVGVMLTAALLVAQRVFGMERRARASFMTTSLPVTVVAISTIVVLVYATSGGVSHDLSRTTLDEVSNPRSKFAIWRASAELIRETPWVGVGRGAFEPSITHAHPAAAFHSFSHVENEYLQAFVDYGIPGACMLGLGVIWIIVVALRRWRDGPLTAGAIGGAAVIALQSTVDFGIALIGIAIPLTVLVASLTYVPLREGEQREKAIAIGLRGAHVVGLAGSAILLLMSVTTSIAEDHDALRGRKNVPFEEIQDSIERHPLDYYGYALAAQVLYQKRDPRAVNLLNHALRLHPAHPGLHHIAARALVQIGRTEQAAIEYAHALRGRVTIQPLLTEIVQVLPPKQVAAAIPVDMTNFDQVVRILMDVGASKEAVTMWVTRVLQARPGDIRACDRLYAFAIRDKDVQAAEEASGKCVDHALDHSARVALAAMLLQKERFAQATRTVHDVERWDGRIDVRTQGWLVLCDVEIAQARWDEGKRCLRKLDVSGLVTPQMRREVTTRLEKIEQLRAQDPKTNE